MPLVPTSKDSISSNLHFSFIFRMFAKLITSLGIFPNRSINSASKTPVAAGFQNLTAYGKNSI